jgi:hypothetical protein
MTINALNPEAPTTPAPATGVQPGPASSSATEQRRPARPLGDPSRCHFRYPNGRRCTLPGLSAMFGLCLRHYNRQVATGLPLTPLHDDSVDLSSDLLPELAQCSSSVDLRRFLSRLLVLVAQGRVSPRRASVLSYITQQLLHSSVPSKKEPALSPVKSSLLRLARNVTEETRRRETPND